MFVVHIPETDAYISARKAAKRLSSAKDAQLFWSIEDAVVSALALGLHGKYEIVRSF